ncbi:MAG: helix-hairpin-helix domain-containing protein, partial [Spirochaetales bacterium]|nr:helix-hairpin-helix domain-containing protein [Spirochaetales bacterium]
ASLNERSLLTSKLDKAIEEADSSALLEDIYLPYRQKRKTRSDSAKTAGLNPLADWLLKKGTVNMPISEKALAEQAENFFSEEHNITSIDDALGGARDILAEIFNEDKQIRQTLRSLFEREGIISAKTAAGKEKSREIKEYKDYTAWREPAARAPSHRILAVLRGAEAGVLTVHMLPEEERALQKMGQFIFKGRFPAENAAAFKIEKAIKDCYKRLTAPSLELALKKSCKERADKEALRVFSENLKGLLLSPPLGEKRVIAIDPGLRTGCKIVCLDEQGGLLEHQVIFPLPPFKQEAASKNILINLCQKYSIEAAAVGNGTGGREAERLAKEALQGLSIPVIMVNESGASVYSASDTAREEFPNQDITVRGAVSIGRRLIDPLAELVKIDPKSIGVGQYQHDVDQKLLKQSLQDVVTSCVNAVGVEVNTASRELLSYVSGITPRIAEYICLFRHQRGPFLSRLQLKEVSGIGPKCFEQAAGFLRIRNGSDPLDASAVHPESFHLVQRMASDLGCSVKDLMNNEKLRNSIQLSRYVTETAGIPTLQDIMKELEKPGRDPRADFTYVSYSDEVYDISDLRPGMKLPGVVTNVTAFGAFVDIGVHKDGLIHISELSDTYVRDPYEVVKVQQQIVVTVLEVEPERNRIKLSLKTQ